MKLYVVRGLTLVWVFGTLYLSIALFLRTDIDQSLIRHEHLPHRNLQPQNDPVLLRRQVVNEFKNIHQGAALVKLSTDTASEAPARDRSTGWSSYLQYAMNGDSVWPKEHGEINDRILNQIHTVHSDPAGTRLKKIVLYPGLDGGMQAGQSRFIEHQCPVNQCSLSDKQSDAATADMIMFNGYLSKPSHPRPRDQIWVLFLLESPYHTQSLTEYDGLVNWTATYRTDSTLVAPYEHYTYFSNYSGVLPKTAPRDYASTKTKAVAWFVSNCGGPNGRRSYVDQLQQHISVDIFGACGTMQCPRQSTEQCNTMLQEKYFFYLSFENSNCKDYITEKLFWNALKNDVIPIVMGAPRSDYERLAPPESFIHVDDFATPRDLAEFLKQLMTDKDRYNSYFRWKGSGEYIDTKYWCRLCAMLHESRRTGYHSVYHKLDAWWRGPGVCVDPVQDGPGYATWRTATVTNNSDSFHQQWTEIPRTLARKFSSVPQT